MKIERIRALNGANIYSHEPVLVMEIDLGELKGMKSRAVPNFDKNFYKLYLAFGNTSAAAAAVAALSSALTKARISITSLSILRWNCLLRPVLTIAIKRLAAAMKKTIQKRSWKPQLWRRPAILCPNLRK